MEKITYKHAEKKDATGIVDLIQPFVKTGALLQRTVADVEKNIDNFFVAIDREKIVGCVALRDFGDGLEEVRTLCVDENYAKKEIGTHLVGLCIKLAKKRNAKQVFALSLRPNLFIRKGFNIVEMENLPEKVWKDDQVSSPDEKALILFDFKDYIE